MAVDDGPVKEPWQAVESRHAMAFLVLLVALAAAGLGLVSDMLEALVGGIFAYALAIGLVRLWGDRTRPKPSAGWALVYLLWGVGLFLVSFPEGITFRAFFLAFLLVLVAAFHGRHDSGFTPTMLLIASVWAALFTSGKLFAGQGDSFGEGDAIWIASSVVFGIVAATLEHERLARRQGAGTPTAWTVFRLAFVAVWTIVVVSLREDIQWGRLFVLLGADLSGQAGQILLVGVLLAAFALAAFALRPSKRDQKGS